MTVLSITLFERTLAQLLEQVVDGVVGPCANDTLGVLC